VSGSCGRAAKALCRLRDLAFTYVGLAKSLWGVACGQSRDALFCALGIDG